MLNGSWVITVIKPNRGFSQAAYTPLAGDAAIDLGANIYPQKLPWRYQNDNLVGPANIDKPGFVPVKFPLVLFIKSHLFCVS